MPADEINGHYGVFCDVCHAPVEYADITSHVHVQPKPEEVDDSWNYKLTADQQESADRFRRRSYLGGIFR